jgi:hypothetical protein
MALVYRNIIVLELATKLYQISSSFKVPVQEGFGLDWVAPVVFAATDEEQLEPNSVVLIAVALVHSSLAGAWAYTLRTIAAVITMKIAFLKWVNITAILT